MDTKAIWKPLGTLLIVMVLSILSTGRSQEKVGGAAEENATQANGQVRYVLKFAKGQSYDIRVGIRQERVEEGEKEARPKSGREQAPSESQPFLVNMTLYYRFNVKSVDNSGNALADCTVRRVKIEQKLGFVPDVDYDSADATKQVIPQVEGMDDVAYGFTRGVSAYLGAQFTLKVMPHGYAQDVGGVESFVKHVWRKSGVKPSENPDEAVIAGTKKEIRTFFWAHPFADYPQSPVGPGDSWTRTEKAGDGVEWETRWTVKERKAGVAAIEVVGEAKKKDPAGPGRWHRTIGIDEATGEIPFSMTRREEPGMVAVNTFEMVKDSSGHKAAKIMCRTVTAGERTRSRQGAQSCSILFADTVANPVDNASVLLAAVSADSNDLRWDLAEDFEFRWTAAELSAKVVCGGTSNSLERTLTISGELRILDTEGLVTIESDRPRIVKISDGHGNAVPCQFEQGSAARWYDDRGWQWHSGPQGLWGGSVQLDTAVARRSQ